MGFSLELKLAKLAGFTVATLIYLNEFMYKHSGTLELKGGNCHALMWEKQADVIGEKFFVVFTF